MTSQDVIARLEQAAADLIAINCRVTELMQRKEDAIYACESIRSRLLVDGIPGLADNTPREVREAHITALMQPEIATLRAVKQEISCAQQQQNEAKTEWLLAREVARVWAFAWEAAYAA